MSARFVILSHDHPFPHWDLMLEWGPALRSWRLLEKPDASGPVAAQAIGDHRREYLDYQGPVSGGRGHVSQWDGGTFEIVDQTEDALALAVRGKLLAGRVTLTHKAEEHWQFVYCGSP